MKYYILLDDEPIGTLHDPRADEWMGVVHGEWVGVVHGPFTPRPAYEKVRPLFERFSEAGADGDEAALKTFYRDRDALNLRVTTEVGLPVATYFVMVYENSRGSRGWSPVPEAEFVVPQLRFFDDPRYWMRNPDCS